MNSYLTLAEQVLRLVGRPLKAKSILNEGYLRGIVPSHLYGKTQHKTMNARISEDILHKQAGSKFYRTKPGEYFLREFRHAVPEKDGIEFKARRRVRDIVPKSFLIIDRQAFKKLQKTPTKKFRNAFSQVRKEGGFCYQNRIEISELEIPVWVFICVKRGQELLTYRIGRYQEEDNGFMNKKTLGFRSMVSEEQFDLFSLDGLGLFNSVLDAVAFDLDAESIRTSQDEFEFRIHHLFEEELNSVSIAVFSIVVDCPLWFEPTGKRLSINHLAWENLSTQPNNLDDFDPWSRSLFKTGVLKKIISKDSKAFGVRLE